MWLSRKRKFPHFSTIQSDNLGWGGGLVSKINELFICGGEGNFDEKIKRDDVCGFVGENFSASKLKPQGFIRVKEVSSWLQN